MITNSSYDDFFDFTGVGMWLTTECGQRAAGENNVAHILKPCCYQLTGECKLTTHQHCTFLGGYYHAEGPEHCSKVRVGARGLFTAGPNNIAHDTQTVLLSTNW